MFRKALVPCLAAILVCPVWAQAPEEENNDNRTEREREEQETKAAADAKTKGEFWQASIKGGNFIVALDKISSVSRHKYLLDGTVVVDEVTVDTVGQALARFYFISPATDAGPAGIATSTAALATDAIDGASKLTGSEIQYMVVKKYPDTTHAKSIEFRILTKKDLDALFSSVSGAWQSGRGRQYSVK